MNLDKTSSFTWTTLGSLLLSTAGSESKGDRAEKEKINYLRITSFKFQTVTDFKHGSIMLP